MKIPTQTPAIVGLNVRAATHLLRCNRSVVAKSATVALACLLTSHVSAQTATPNATQTPASGSTAPAATSPTDQSSSSAPSSATPPLQQVLVTGKRLEEEIPQQLSEYGTRLETVTAAQIQDGGYLDIASALQYQAPGLFISSKNGPFDYVQISLQGSRTEDVLWLVDGVRINNRLYGGTTPLDTIPASMVDRVEVLYGGQSLFYGTQAVAGAVNIVTRPFTDHPDGAWSLGLDTNDGKNMYGYFSNAIGRNDFVLYASHDESPGIQPFPDADYQPSGTDRHRAYNVTTLGLKYGYNFTDQLAFSTLLQRTDAKLDFANPFLVADAYNERDETLLTAKLDYVASDAFKLYLKYYYHWWYSYYTEYDNGSTPYMYTPGAPGEITVANSDDFWGFKDYGVNLMTQIAVNHGFEYLAGYDYQGYTGRDAVLVIEQQTEHVNAFFAQVRSMPDFISGAHLALGARYNIPSIGQSALVWDASGQYDFSKFLFMRANFGTAFRLPTAEELFANDPDDERGDPNLKPETSTNANLSIGGLVPMGSAQLRWEAIGFYRSIKNLIDYQYFDSETEQEVFGNVPGTVGVHGGELTLNASFTEALSADFDATYNHSRQTGVDFQFDQIPVWLLKAGLDYHPPQHLYGASIDLIHVGDLDDEPLGVGNGRYGYGNYTLLNMSGRIFLDTARKQRIDLHVNNVGNHVYYAQLGFGVDNVTQNNYVTHDLGLPRTFQVNFTYTF